MRINTGLRTPLRRAAPVWIALVVLVDAAGGDTIGPLSPEPAIAIYIASQGRPQSARIVVRDGNSSRPRHFLVRAFDPDEHPILWRYIEYVDAETLEQVPTPQGIDLRPASQTTDAGDVLFQHDITLDAEGVYQVRVATDWQDTSVRIEAPNPLIWGVCFQNGTAGPWQEQPHTVYIHVPVHAEQLTLRGGALTLRDEEGRDLARLNSASGSATVPVEIAPTLWSLQFDDKASWSLRATGFPVILCPSPQAARAIHASVQILDDGTVVCHRFQERIADLLPGILAPDKVGRAEDLIVSPTQRAHEWLADPLRNAVLVDSFLPAISKWLRAQNVDPASHWGGALDGWQEKAKAPAPENRWDRLKALDGLWGGASSHYGAAAEHLARAALYDAPINPYYGKQELLYRAAAAALRDMMMLSEDETFPGTADMDPYPGTMAFVMGQKTLPVYGVAARHLPANVRDVWTEALSHLVDRSFCDVLVTCRNQSSHYLVAFQAFADGSQNPRHRAMMKLYSRRWVAGQHPTGYHMERCGPDASYIGMTHWHEAVYYRMSGDPLVLESLRRSYRFFNHTVAPEPDGRMLGGFNFNHRIGEGFYLEQWSGAKGILDDVLPEVAVWAGPQPEPEQQREIAQKALQKVQTFLTEPGHPRYPGITSWRYWSFARPDRSAVFPCREPASFIRRFGDELIAVRRPAYYAVCYTGKPAADYYVRQREDFRLPYPDDGESRGAFFANMRKITPYVGGGLSGFWTPQYGHGLLAANWAPTTHHGLTATLEGGSRYWEDYHAHTHVLDREASTLTFTGRIESTPIGYERRYSFGEQAIAVELTLTADEDISLANLVENIPLARGEWKSRGAEIAAGAVKQGEIQADRFSVCDSEGQGMQVVLSKPARLRLVPEGLKTSGWRKLQIGRVEVALPTELEAGRQVRLAYEIKPWAKS